MDVPKHDKVDTVIVGLQNAGYSLDDVAKRLKKDLNTSVTVRKSYNFNGIFVDVVMVQGDITDKIVGVLLMRLKIDTKKVEILPKSQDTAKK